MLRKVEVTVLVAALGFIGLMLYMGESEEVMQEALFEDTSTAQTEQNLTLEPPPLKVVSAEPAEDVTAQVPVPKKSTVASKQKQGDRLSGVLGGASEERISYALRGYVGYGSGSGKVMLGGAGGSIQTRAYGFVANRSGMEFNTNEFAPSQISSWKEVGTDPLSTFSIDVDRASYSMVRRFLNQEEFPSPGAVRLEEIVNYFDYGYAPPADEKPFTVHTDLVACPWNPKHLLARVAMQAKKMDVRKLPTSNFVFLIDVSGSMSSRDRLPLVQEGMKLLVQNIREQDRVAIVVYAGNSGMVLPSTSGKEKTKILRAIESLGAGGSTNGVGGITQAYEVAQQYMIRGGNNRIIWATDGDFNVGVSSTDELVSLVEEKREKGIFLSVLGVGMGNIKDSRLEQIADKGNGNYSYLDNLQEARKVLIHEFSSNLFTLAKDVKLQIEFNPQKVKRWKQLGYENRALANADFTNDRKDAGELGVGHSVTAFYEIEPGEAEESLRYQSRDNSKEEHQQEWMWVKARYKKPNENVSIPLEWVVKGEPQLMESTDESMQFGVGLVAFAKKLRKEEDAEPIQWDWILRSIRANLGEDSQGERAELLTLVRKAMNLNTREQG